MALTERRTVSRGIWNSLRNSSEDQRSQVVRLLVIFLGTWAFLALAHEVRTEATQQLDERVMRAVRRADDPSVPIGPAWVPDIARDVTALGGYSVLILLVAMVAGFLQLHGKRGETRFLVGSATQLDVQTSEVALTQAPGVFNVEWRSVNTGEVATGGTINGGEKVKLTSPFAGPSVLYLWKKSP